MDLGDLQTQLFAGLLFVVGGVLGIVFWVMPVMAKSGGSAFPGVLKVGRRKYNYEIGDLLLRFGGASFYSGIDIHLHKRLPHIYLDAYRNNRLGRRPEFVFDDDDELSLEGDFDSHFKVYAPREHKALALSILTPDVLDVLVRTAYKYDVEIIENHVRLIVRGVVVSRSEQIQQELLDAAQTLMKEIDHKLKSWNENSLTGDTALDVARFNRHFTQ